MGLTNNIAFFRIFIDALKEAGVTFNIHHCCNSAGTLELPDFHREMIRPGIIQYGYDASKEVLVTGTKIKPSCLSLLYYPSQNYI